MLLSKDAVIKEFFTELNAKDIEYNFAMQQQAKDIDDLVTLMARQVRKDIHIHVMDVMQLSVHLLASKSSTYRDESLLHTSSALAVRNVHTD